MIPAECLYRFKRLGTHGTSILIPLLPDLPFMREALEYSICQILIHSSCIR